MSFLLWTDEDKDEAIDLGDPFALNGAFAEMAKIAGDGGDWQELFSVPGFGEQEVDADWRAKVSEQAGRFTEQYGEKLSGHARWILQQLKEDQ